MTYTRTYKCSLNLGAEMENPCDSDFDIGWTFMTE